MSSYILTLRERGVIDKFMVKWNMTTSDDAVSTMNAAQQFHQAQALTLWNVAGVFIVTGIFSVASLLCLLIERWLYYYHHQWRV
ncbi:unnamed protein product [Trichobilharzia szidati]|nr:unnamed protein product [Trichobilharzia szidati]